MVWKARICGEQLYHHIYAWGNDRHPVFKKPVHYQKYLSLLQKHSAAYKVDVIAYALMEWHVHLFIYDDLNNLSDFMFKLHGDYAKYFNRINNRVGHVFGERFNNKVVVPNQYGLWLTRYIHRQPLEAKLVIDPKDYAWTSYRAYVGLEKSKFVRSSIIMSQFGGTSDALTLYEQFVLEERNDEPVDWEAKTLKIKDPEHIIQFIGEQLGVDREIILRPTGTVEHGKRREAIRLLLKKYGYKKAQIARTFNLSRMAVTLMLKDIDKK